MQTELAPNLYGDLSTVPPPERRLFISDIQALDFLLHHPSVSDQEQSAIRQIIADRTSMLIQELAESNPFLNARIAKEVCHQLRSRPDFQTDRLIIEQWVPALNYWLISGTYERDADPNVIIAELQDSDPRIKSARERYAELQEQAKANAAANDQAGSDRVVAAVDSLGSRGVAQFLEVERAIKSGETIIAHGPDLDYLESAHGKTIAAARTGDVESIRTLSSGVSDSDACFNPGHNPVVR